MPSNTPPSSPSGPTGASGPTGPSAPAISNFSLNETKQNANVKVVSQQGVAPDGTEVTKVVLTTVAPNSNVKVSEDLLGEVTAYYDDEGESAKATVMAQIRDYASQIKCEDFHGKGTVDDYSALFQAASKIANDAKQMQLDVDVDGFNEFGAAADSLSALFTSFTVKLQTVSIIDDLVFLQSIASALAKIVNLSNVFGKFQDTIVAVASVELPKSAQDARLLVQSVMTELNCAMTYINNFVSPDPHAPAAAKLTDNDEDIISKAVSTLDNWSDLCDQGVSIAMGNNADIQYLNSASAELKSKAGTLTSATTLLRTKLKHFNLV